MTFDPSPTLLADSYKVSHRQQYPEGTQAIYSNFTPRSSRIADIKHVVSFGLQAFLKDFTERWQRDFFDKDIDEVCAYYEAAMLDLLGPNTVGTDQWRALHALGYIPLRFNALPEGTLVPLRIPMFTVENTVDEFFWLTNYIESWLSNELWLPATSAATAWRLRRLLNKAAERTGGPMDFVAFQGHDFSMRGMTSITSGAASAAGHLLSFTGTDSLPGLEFVKYYYPGDNGFLGGSVPATEHSVMCAGGELSEEDTFSRLMDIHPTGLLSVVSDTWDLWAVLTKLLPDLYEKIMARDGKLVIRPDSGDPVDIICGTTISAEDMAYYNIEDNRTPAQKGVVELLWDVFGGTVNAKGFKELDSHIGVIYGDSINYERADEITKRLEAKGFASTNIVLGVGSYTYQYTTRDTFGFAMKATWAKINGEGVSIFKDPITDRDKNGVSIKKSAKGRLAVFGNKDGTGDYELINEAAPEIEAASWLTPVWEDGKFIRTSTFAEVRERLAAQTKYLEENGTI